MPPAIEFFGFCRVLIDESTGAPFCHGKDKAMGTRLDKSFRALELKQYEEVFFQGLEQAWEAIAHIKKEQLYLEVADNWEEYCTKKLKIPKRTVYRKLHALNLDESVKNPCQNGPRSSAKSTDSTTSTTENVDSNGQVPPKFKKKRPPKTRNTKTDSGISLESRKKPTKQGVELAPGKFGGELRTKFAGPLVRGLDKLGKMLKRRGKNYTKARKALDDFLDALKEMRKGNP